MTEDKRVHNTSGDGHLVLSWGLGDSAVRGAAIEDMEAQGQKSLENSTSLPSKGTVGLEDIFLNMGIELGEVFKDDKLFRPAKLPEGWTKKSDPTHSMHMSLVDNNGCVRAGIFYKAAFYDRRASITLNNRIIPTRDFARDKIERHLIVDNGTLVNGEPKVLWEKVYDIPSMDNDTDNWRTWYRKDIPRKEKAAWLLDNFPDWEDPTAYWDK